jgi:hypothetical protein
MRPDIVGQRDTVEKLRIGAPPDTGEPRVIADSQRQVLQGTEECQVPAHIHRQVLRQAVGGLVAVARDTAVAVSRRGGSRQAVAQVDRILQVASVEYRLVSPLFAKRIAPLAVVANGDPHRTNSSPLRCQKPALKRTSRTAVRLSLQ